VQVPCPDFRLNKELLLLPVLLFLHLHLPLAQALDLQQLQEQHVAVVAVKQNVGNRKGENHKRNAEVFSVAFGVVFEVAAVPRCLLHRCYFEEYTAWNY
jgi:hypothetical protein